jgi:hypothetical protein
LSDLFPNSAGEIRLAQERFQTQFDHRYYPLVRLRPTAHHTVPYFHNRLPGSTHASASQDNQTVTQPISSDLESDNEDSSSDLDEILELSFQTSSNKTRQPNSVQLTSSSFVQNELDSNLPTCCVCLCEMENGGSVWKCAACSNFIHFPCAEEWVKVRANCPLCRAGVS